MANLILIDYDNLEHEHKKNGCLYFVKEIAKQINPSEINNKNLLFRLYGGWYENNNITRTAQDLSNQISTDFPNTCFLSDNITKVVVNLELAYGLISQPTKHLFHTYRKRNMPTGLKCNSPLTNTNCIGSSCTTKYIHEFLKNDSCSSCSIKPSDIIYRGEQKLVDTMLTSDLIFTANQNLNVCLVTSDDDLWPGILSALYTGVKVTHIHTKSRSTNPFYLRTANSNYIQKSI